MDYTQILLIITLALTSLFLVLVGINLILVLIELKKTLKNVNSVADGIEKFGKGFGHGVKEAINIFKIKKSKT